MCMRVAHRHDDVADDAAWGAGRGERGVKEDSGDATPSLAMLASPLAFVVKEMSVHGLLRLRIEGAHVVGVIVPSVIQIS